MVKITNTQPSIPKPSPKEFDLPHTEWRDGQYEAMMWVRNSANRVNILEASTGSGKSSLATGAHYDGVTTALARTKMLQQENYERGYNYDVLYGRANYECVHDDAELGMRANQCFYQQEGMHKCPVAGDCPYLIQKNFTMFSKRRGLNYAYYMLSKWPKENVGDILVMDEGHLLSDIVLDYAGISVHDRTREEWGLPPFPEIVAAQTSLFFDDDKLSSDEQALGWLRKSKKIVDNEIKGLLRRAITDEEARKKLRRAESLSFKLQSSIDSITLDSSQWYIRSGRGHGYYRGAVIPGLVAKPLTARYHFSNIFLRYPKHLIMSATIGNVRVFAEELGIDEFDFLTVPSVWPAETRPVRILDAPRMGRGSSNDDYEKQADVIADAIKSVPDSWMGIIHVTRKTESKLLAERLGKRGLGNRVWTPPVLGGTNYQIEKWNEEKEKRKRKGMRGGIAIVYSWAEGVDLSEEKICISAKAPFPFLGDPYEQARMKNSPKFYSQRTAWTLEQSLGRTRRGVREHYDVDGEVNGLVAIADGNWTRVKKYLSKAFLESIVYD